MNEKAPELIEDLNFVTAPPVPKPLLLPWQWALVIGGALLVLFIVWKLWRKRSRRLAALRAGGRVGPPAHVSALAALKELESMIAPGREREFTQRASDIVRFYIQDRFALRAPHRSTEEFLLEASRSGALSAEHQESLAGFLTECDMVKFAKQEVVVDQMKAMLVSARKFVEATIERSVPDLAAGGHSIPPASARARVGAGA